MLSSQNNPDPRADSPASPGSHHRASPGCVPATLEPPLPCPVSPDGRGTGGGMPRPGPRGLGDQCRHWGPGPLPLAHRLLSCPMSTQSCLHFGFWTRGLTSRAERTRCSVLPLCVSHRPSFSVSLWLCVCLSVSLSLSLSPSSSLLLSTSLPLSFFSLSLRLTLSLSKSASFSLPLLHLLSSPVPPPPASQVPLCLTASLSPLSLLSTQPSPPPPVGGILEHTHTHTHTHTHDL